jgi:aerobic-type carbon monoxide dehydrogenase small subunit (CoxS/CutS family)
MNRPRAEFLAGTETTEFRVNGRKVASRAPRVARLADVLRDELGLTGTKIGCNAGDCGACTVLLDGRQVCACLTALGQVEDRNVLTVEGLAENGKLAPLQVAFQNHGAAQCGICTPGMLMAAADLLSRNRRPKEDEVKDALAGVLCRCTGYQKILEAVLDVARRPALAPSPAAGKAVRGPARWMASPNSPAPRSTARTRFPPMRCGCASSARRTIGQDSPSAISPPTRSRPAWIACSPRKTSPPTASASTRISRTSRCWPTAKRAFAAKPSPP